MITHGNKADLIFGGNHNVHSIHKLVNYNNVCVYEFKYMCVCVNLFIDYLYNITHLDCRHQLFSSLFS